MFFYQAAIMLAVVLIVCLLAFVLKIRRTFLALTIALLVVAGGLSLSIIQDYFENHYYTQKINTGLYKNMILTQSQKTSLPKIFKDYSAVGTSADQYQAALEKTYRESADGAESTVKAQILLFKTKAGADEYFKLRQVFYENEYYLPSDPKLTDKSANDSFRYLTSYIKSYYSNRSDLIYIPSKIYYLSDVVIQNDNLIIYITEKSNRAVSLKSSVLSDIGARLSDAG